MIDAMSPYVPAPPWKTCSAMSGSVTWNSQASVPTTVIMINGTSNSGVCLHVPQAGPDLAPFLARPLRGEQFSRAHQEQRDQHRRERDSVEREAHDQAKHGHEEPAEGRPEHPGKVQRDRVQRDRVRQLLRADHFRDETLPSGVVEHVHESQYEREQVHHPHLDDAGADQHREDPRQQAGERLGDEQHAPLVQPVGDEPAERPEHEDGHEPGRRGQPEIRAASGQLQHQESKRHRLHPGAHHREQLAAEVQAVVPVPQGQGDAIESEPASYVRRAAVHDLTSLVSLAKHYR